MRAMMAIPPPNPMVPIFRNVRARAARDSFCLSSFGGLRPVTFTHARLERWSWHPTPGRFDRESSQIEDIEAVYIQIDHEVGRSHGVHGKNLRRLGDDDVRHLQEYQPSHSASSHAVS